MSQKRFTCRKCNMQLSPKDQDYGLCGPCSKLNWKCLKCGVQIVSSDDRRVDLCFSCKTKE